MKKFICVVHRELGCFPLFGPAHLCLSVYYLSCSEGIQNQPLGGDTPFKRKLEIEASAKFANVPTIKNKLYWCTGTGLAMGDIWRPLGIDIEKYIQEMVPPWGTEVAHTISGCPLKVYSPLTNSRVVHWSFQYWKILTWGSDVTLFLLIFTSPGLTVKHFVLAYFISLPIQWGYLQHFPKQLGLMS